MVRFTLLTLANLVLGLAVVPASAQMEQSIIATGPVTELAYPVGGAICERANERARPESVLSTGANTDAGTKGADAKPASRADVSPLPDVRCLVVPSNGAKDNLALLDAGHVAFGLVPSDQVHQAYEGVGLFEGKEPATHLRSVFTLHMKPLTVIARADSGIRFFQDLKGKRIDIGLPGSSEHRIMNQVMDALGWGLEDFSSLSEKGGAEPFTALCDNKIDAMVFTAGHPSSALARASNQCDLMLVTVDGAAINDLVSQTGYFHPATIAGGLYRGSDEDVKTFGVSTTLVTTDQVSDERIYELVKSIFSDFDAFKALHPALAMLEVEDLVKTIGSVPLHPGAARFFREQGWID